MGCLCAWEASRCFEEGAIPVVPKNTPQDNIVAVRSGVVPFPGVFPLLEFSQDARFSPPFLSTLG